MKNADVLYFIASFLFLIAGILSFVNGSNFRGGIGIAAFIAMFLAGFNHRKNNKV